MAGVVHNRVSAVQFAQEGYQFIPVEVMPQGQVYGAVCEHYRGLTFIIESKWFGILPDHYFFVSSLPFFTRWRSGETNN